VSRFFTNASRMLEELDRAAKYFNTSRQAVIKALIRQPSISSISHGGAAAEPSEGRITSSEFTSHIRTPFPVDLMSSSR